VKVMVIGFVDLSGLAYQVPLMSTGLIHINADTNPNFTLTLII
jgi:hypothetical protein